MTATKAETGTPPEILDVYHIAREVSRETRQMVASDLDGFVFDPPASRWDSIIAERVAEGHQQRAVAATRQLLARTRPECIRAVQRTTKALLKAVADLAEFVPEYEPHELELPASIAKRMGFRRRDRTFYSWTPTAASVARLDELRVKVRLRLIELDSLYEDFPDPLARLLAVAARAAHTILSPTTATLVSTWCERLRAGEETAAAA